MNRRKRDDLMLPSAALSAALALAAAAYGDGGVTFTDIAAGGGAGLVYSRVPSERNQILDDLVGGPPLSFVEIASTPTVVRGKPGAAIFDYDGDGDLDIYVTNGPGADNSLFSNQLRQTGQLSFVDVAVEAGVAARAQDSEGVAYGDIDNDGDTDLLVLGAGEPSMLFENDGAGAGGIVTFTDITDQAGVGGGTLYHNSASLGDVNGDGLLDIVVANTFDYHSLEAIFLEPFALSQHNQLYLNTGGNVFVDASDVSGILETRGFVPPSAAGSPGISWSIAMVDVDLDGDVDIMTGDDQAGVPTAIEGGVNRGVLHLFRNDGTGHFTDVNVAAGIALPEAWMGLAYGDFNSDGHLDFFASNFGDHSSSIVQMMPALGALASRWFLGQSDGTFADPGVGALVATPFGWGCAARDFDNDGDTDILFHGGLNAGFFIELSNPGTLLLNDGQANFTFDPAAFAGSTNHLLRTVQGVAVGDLDEDGFVDVVSVSNFETPPGAPIPNPFPLGSVFDPSASFVPVFVPTGGGLFTFNGSILDYPNGTLSVEISSGDNGNGGVTVSTLGTVGITSGGAVNRDGIGAVVRFTPRGGSPVMQPILSGSSHLSQNSLAAHFGLGQAAWGTVEVLWPGGVRNRLGPVLAGSRVLFPEIPCSFDDPGSTFQQYRDCVAGALDELIAADVLEPGDRGPFLSSAVTAWQSVH